ncbi:flagellar biosynthesis chaperone [Clostridium liquoris]|jgi:flagellar FliJ protein|uniref:Flagellar FliJ protein n=1 Tax=Clostridium liquoris TaxID=1289519 RepID=A0A2T0B1G4_9CLOT|nr:flagellar export protein FliJ [Clostridium liquoris]PRR77532.1 flagellar biosynthesis chaperone [Clostridium liquoris]
MKGYKFRLQKLLDIRIDIEEEYKRKFQQAQSIKEEVENRLDSLKTNYDKYNTVNSKDSIIDRKIKNQYLIALNSSIESTASELRDKEEAVEEVRLDLTQKQIERKTVEHLKEKSLQSFIKEQNLIEQKANDEFALYGFIRNINKKS